MTTRAITKAKTSILAAVHETASDLYRLGLIDRHKMEKLDALCLEPVPSYSAAAIKAIRPPYFVGGTREVLFAPAK